MIIGIDIDGVILDFERTMNTLAEFYDLLVLKKNGVVNKKEFNYLKRYDWTEEERNLFVDKYLISGTYKTSLLPGVKEGLSLLREKGCRIEIITARGSLKKETKEAVLKVLKSYDISFDNITFEVADKLMTCQNLKVDVMIDDNPNTCEILSNNYIKTLYFRDKNSRKLKKNKYLKEVSNWGEICREILFLLNK